MLPVKGRWVSVSGSVEFWVEVAFEVFLQLKFIFFFKIFRTSFCKILMKTVEFVKRLLSWYLEWDFVCCFKCSFFFFDNTRFLHFLANFKVSEILLELPLPVFNFDSGLHLTNKLFLEPAITKTNLLPTRRTSLN